MRQATTQPMNPFAFLAGSLALPGVFIAAAFVPFLWPTPAAAAPQILGLVASAAPVPLTCSGGECSAEFPSFCMQKERTMPRIGAAYRAGPNTRITLGFTGPEGRRHSVTVSKTARITAEREYFAVRISVPYSVIAAYGGSRPSLSMGPLASAVPLPAETHKFPLDQKEIAFITGPHRKTVEVGLKSTAGAPVAVTAMSRMINALPRHATETGRATVWDRVIGVSVEKAASGELGPGHHQAAQAHDYCKNWADTGRGYGMRDCLREWHDHRADDITEKAWDMQKPGM